MPKENIERAIKRVSEKETAALSELTIQAMGLGSVALIIEAITDNKNRTINVIKHILAENDFKMVSENSLNWMFGKDWEPNTPTEATAEIQQKLDKLLEELDNNEDVEEIHTNLK